MLNLIKHLLPRNKLFNLIVDRDLRKFFSVLGDAVEDLTVNFFDLIWSDLFPATTRELTAWEQAFGLQRLDLTASERRERLAGLWSATGGQSPRYIQDVLQAAGFDAYVYDHWSNDNPYTVRNPFNAIGGYLYGCGEPIMQCGEPIAQCGEYTGANGYVLVNKIYNIISDIKSLCGEPEMQCGEPEALCGNLTTPVCTRQEYNIPTDTDYWPYFVYIGGATFGEQIALPLSRLDEFEDLCLKICPAHLWIIIFADYGDYLIEDLTGEYIIDDATDDYVIDG